MGSHVLHTCNDPPCHVPQQSAHACTCNDPPCTEPPLFPFLFIFCLFSNVNLHIYIYMLPCKACMPFLYLSRVHPTPRIVMSVGWFVRPYLHLSIQIHCQLWAYLVWVIFQGDWRQIPSHVNSISIPFSILSSPCVVGFPRRWEGLGRGRGIQAQSKRSPPPLLAHRSATTIDCVGKFVWIMCNLVISHVWHNCPSDQYAQAASQWPSWLQIFWLDKYFDCWTTMRSLWGLMSPLPTIILTFDKN